jgi:putative ABC transport system permease protein
MDSIHANYFDIDAGSVDVWDIKIIAGQNLPRIPAEKDDNKVLINEKMAGDLHFASTQQAIGQHLLLGNKDVEIAGVVNNFQFLDVSRQIEPLMLRNRKSEFGYVTVKIKGNNPAGTVAFLKDAWKKVNPSSKFEYEFFDQQLLMTHAIMTDTAGIVGVLAILAVLISSLGLLGMATYTVETRRKEISVRKVLGSSVTQVATLLSRGYITLLAIAVIISVPLAVIINNLWLQNFASRVTISPWMLLIDTFVVIGVSVLIVFSQAWRVSRANPAMNLRSE